jgi:hypothetical protein
MPMQLEASWNLGDKLMDESKRGRGVRKTIE